MTKYQLCRWKNSWDNNGAVGVVNDKWLFKLLAICLKKLKITKGESGKEVNYRYQPREKIVPDGKGMYWRRTNSNSKYRQDARSQSCGGNLFRHSSMSGYCRKRSAFDTGRRNGSSRLDSAW